MLEALGGVALDWTLQLSESRLARVHYIIRLGEDPVTAYDVAMIEARLVQTIRAWEDELREALIDEHGEEDGIRLFKRYERAFPAGYKSDWVARSAVADIGRIEELAATDEPITSLYRPLESPEGIVRLKLFSSGGVLLSEVLPTLEHLGAKVADERPYEITPADRGSVWIYDFGLQADAENTERVRDLLHDTFLGVWRGELEDDALNGLVLGATLTGRQVSIIRAVAKYLRQGGIGFSDSYIGRTLLGHPAIVRLLIRLFDARLDPDAQDEDAAERLGKEIEEALDAVPSLDEDRILRSFLSVVRAIVRTNTFQTDRDGKPHAYLSFKLDSAQIPVLPLPVPQFEIFVYSPRVEAVHLRGGRVARGGIRWSDRPEDFRTEVLGLMKAQMVKNALIVPVGAKGGFVVKRPPAEGGREALLNEGIACYKAFLSGMLDITDNIVEGEVVPPKRVIRYDGDDPYLVVAADKGTAAFSDIANGVSADYGFWLGDAFASGGSQGYDHKKMGITARGAWESVKRHFRELGTDIQTTDFTAVGIGDMSGDVFGNGMLCSRHTKLLAAFNHMHVFLDPDPDPEASYDERRRLFDLPRSAWSDYDESLISEGGGIHSRAAKSIQLSPQVREALGIEEERLAPNDLVHAILKAQVDLLYNGGIGTYVKASTESHADVGDKANDAVRVDARELRCKVVGEGGNLGVTQRARIEYALSGGPADKSPAHPGRIITDAIDNVAGVNCSDHEVNIKILLDGLVADGDLTEKQRNELLVEMTDAVGEQVLYGSYTQTQAISLALAQAAPMVDVHARLIRNLEQTAGLNRKLEFLPSDDAIDERKAAHQGLVSPELAVIMAYQKIHLYQQLLESDLPEDPLLAHDLERYFPPPLARALLGPDGRPPPEARDHRHGRRQPARRPRRHDVLVPARRGDGCAARSAGAGVRDRARGARDALVLGRGRSTRQSSVRSDPARDADRGPAPRRALDPLARPRQPLPGQHRPDDQALRSRREDARRIAARRARRRGPRGVRQAGGGAAAGRRSRRARQADRRNAVDARAVRHRRGGLRDRARSGRRAAGVLPARLAAGAQLAARPDHRAAAREPLAGAGPRGAPRRPVQPVPGADPQGARRSAGRRTAVRPRSTRGPSATPRRSSGRSGWWPT